MATDIKSYSISFVGLSVYLPYFLFDAVFYEIK